MGTPTSVEDAFRLLRELGAPPRLVQHHRLVAEAAAELLDGIPHDLRANISAGAVLLGSALHDAGKILYPSELVSPGVMHEQAGERLLLEHGVAPRLARCCVTHAQWQDPRAEVEDRLVALADKLWKGKRHQHLEELVMEELANSAGTNFWAVYPLLAMLFDRIAEGGDDRLARS